MNFLQQIQAQVLSLDPFAEMLQIIDEVYSIADLDRALHTFQQNYKAGRFTPEQTTIIVEKGKAKRADLSTAERRVSPAREALSRARFQGPGGVPRPNPYQLPDEERDLYLKILKVNLRSHDPMKQLETLELVYMEKERSEAGKKMLLDAFGKKLRELSAVWAEVKGAK